MSKFGSKRELFAAFALQALIAKLPVIDWEAEYGEKLEEAEHIAFKRDVAESAIGYADALIKALEGTE